MRYWEFAMLHDLLHTLGAVPTCAPDHVWIGPFLSIYDHGQAYTEQEYRDWLAEAGFVDFERVPLPSNPKNSIITAGKPTA